MNELNYSKILNGLFLGSLEDSRDKEMLKKNDITHIVSVIEDAKPYFKVVSSHYSNLKFFKRLNLFKKG